MRARAAGGRSVCRVCGAGTWASECVMVVFRPCVNDGGRASYNVAAVCAGVMSVMYTLGTRAPFEPRLGVWRYFTGYTMTKFLLPCLLRQRVIAAVET